MITGLSGPDGICSDKKGDIWVANNLAADVVEYKHGGTSPKATLSDPNVYPVGCSVDPMTGNLAVTNIFTTSGGQGSVAVYAGAAGRPRCTRTRISTTPISAATITVAISSSTDATR